LSPIIIIRIIKSWVRWTGHIARMEEKWIQILGLETWSKDTCQKSKGYIYRILLKWIWTILNDCVWIGLFWPWIGNRGRLLRARFHKVWKMSWPAQQLLVS
jgi:hypothetical protein